MGFSNITPTLDPVDQAKLDFLEPAPTQDADLDQMQTDITTLLAKGDARFVGIFADPTALEAAFPAANETIGSTASVSSTDTMWYVNGSNVWADSLIGYIGDMLKSVYDPTNQANDPRDYANALGITQITGTIITPAQLTLDTDDYNPTGFSTCNVIRQDISFDKLELSGLLAPAGGVNRIIRIANLSTVNSIKFMNNNAGSLAANRFLIRDDNDKDLKPNETASFWYDHTSVRWRPLSRVG